MEGNKGGVKFPAPSFSAENEPFYDLLKTGNNTNHQSGVPPAVDFGENILPSYDFHPTRPAPTMSNSVNKILSPTLSEQSLDGKASIGETLRPKPERNASENDENSTAVAAVERTMKKYADNLMRVLEDMRGKLTQLERTTDRLESTVAELQNRSADHHGEVDGRVRGLEHVLREVQRGVQLLRDKSELAEAQAELAKMQVTATSGNPPPSTQPPSALVAPPQTFPALTAPPAVAEEPAKPAALVQPQVEQQAPAPVPVPVPLPSAPSAPPQQLSPLPPQYQHPPQAPSQSQAPARPQQQGPPQQQPNYSHPPAYMPQQPSASAPPPPPAPQQPQQPQVQNAPQPPPPQYGPQAPPYMQRPPLQQQQDAPAYLPQGYGQQPGAPPQQMPLPPPQQGPQRQGYEGAPQQGLPHPGGRLALPAPPGSYNPPPPQGYTDRPVSAGGYDRPPSASYERPTPGYEREARPSYDRPPPVGYDRQSGYEPRVPASPYGPPQFAPGGAPTAPGAYPRLQMAQPVPSAEPPRAASSGGPPQLSTSKMPIEQVIDDVAAMGFHKDEVRSVVRQLTDTGKSVDLNIVLDTLMTRSGGSAQPNKGGWYGR